jgi:hypothetical protein
MKSQRNPLTWKEKYEAQAASLNFLYKEKNNSDTLIEVSRKVIQQESKSQDTSSSKTTIFPPKSNKKTLEELRFELKEINDKIKKQKNSIAFQESLPAGKPTGFISPDMMKNILKQYELEKVRIEKLISEHGIENKSTIESKLCALFGVQCRLKESSDNYYEFELLTDDVKDDTYRKSFPPILEQILKTGLKAQLSLGYTACALFTTLIVPTTLTIRATRDEILEKLNIVLMKEKISVSANNLK